MKNLSALLALMLPCAAFAAANSTTVQVSFTITQACQVQQQEGKTSVTCVADTPYLLDVPARATDGAAASAPAVSPPSAGGAPTTVYF